jgi:CRISPR/Cas system-associated exonuclease Cas4 (RecB family)
VLFRKSGKAGVWQLGTDRENALDTLRRFRGAEKGKKNPVPPAEWKCRRCEFRWKCVLGRKAL